jgi:hypothetical protein
MSSGGATSGGGSSGSASASGGGGGGGNQISLQIMGPGSGGLNSNSVGGPLGEWSQKITSFGCVAGCVMMLIGAAAAVSIGALYFVYTDESGIQCVGTVADISFSYFTWLQVLGFTFLASLVLEFILVCSHGVSGTTLTSKLAKWWGIVMYTFQAAWYVVGAILLWQGKTTDCADGSRIQQFSLALFIIESVVLVCLVCGRKAAESA